MLLLHCHTLIYNFSLNIRKVSLTFFEACAIISVESKLSVRKEDIVKNRLEELRKERGIKQEELAAAMEVSRQTIGSLENGRYNPSIILAFKLAHYFNLSIEEIFIYQEEHK